MAGYVRRRGKGAWEVTVDLGRDPATKRRKRRFFSVKGKREDAERKLTEVLRERDMGSDLDPGKVTLAEYLRRWLRDYAQHNVAASTLERYKGIVEHHLIPSLGAVRLRDLRPGHVQEMYSRALTNGRADGRSGGLSARSVLQHHRVLREALAHAVQWQLLGRNPADAVKPPQPQRLDIRILSPEEARHLLGTAEGDAHHALIYVALTTGARLGELLALRWSDLDLETGMMTIIRTAQRLQGQGIVFHAPKTHRAARPVALSPDTVQVFRSQRRAQAEQRLALGAAYGDNNLVFARPTGDALDGPAVTKAFQRIAASAGLGHLRFHDLRHAAASLMLAAGVNPKIVSERLGHTSVAFTLQVYSHVLPGLQREAAAVLDGVLGARAGSG